jgi:hypothetical protein
MSDRVDPVEMLRAANPVDSYRMEPSVQERMTSSILAEPRSVRRHSVLHAWELKAASAAAAVGAIVAAVVVALGGGAAAPLSLLSISALQQSTSGPTHGGHGTTPPVTFVAGPQLSSSSSSAPVYSFSYPADPTTEVTSVATTLGIANPRVVAGGDNGCGVVVGGDTSVVFTGGAIGTDCNPSTEWLFNLKLPACNGLIKNAAGQLVPCPVAWGLDDSGATNAQVAQWSASAAAALTPSGLTLGSPTFFPNVATYPCEIDSAAIDGCAETFRYTNAGELTEASGPLSVTGAYTQLGDYPLASPRDAVSGVEFDALSRGSANPTTATVVTLTSSTLVYEVATMTNGSTTLVPAYSYTGSNGGTYTAVAVSPSLVQEASSHS